MSLFELGGVMGKMNANEYFESMGMNLGKTARCGSYDLAITKCSTHWIDASGYPRSIVHGARLHAEPGAAGCQ